MTVAVPGRLSMTGLAVHDALTPLGSAEMFSAIAPWNDPVPVRVKTSVVVELCATANVVDSATNWMVGNAPGPPCVDTWSLRNTELVVEEDAGAVP